MHNVQILYSVIQKARVYLVLVIQIQANAYVNVILLMLMIGIWNLHLVYYVKMVMLNKDHCVVCTLFLRSQNYSNLFNISFFDSSFFHLIFIEILNNQ